MATETKFTPGPWTVDVGGFSSASDYQQTFSVNGPESDFMYLKLVADAHLIAAAPDLYEALEAIIAWEQREDGPFAWEVLGQAKDALAKARGEVD